MSSQRLYLLTNATATGSAADWQGGMLSFSVSGTFSGATVTLQILGPDDATYVPVSSATTLTAAGTGTAWVPRGKIKAAITGGPPSAMYAVAAGVLTQ